MACDKSLTGCVCGTEVIKQTREEEERQFTKSMMESYQKTNKRFFALIIFLVIVILIETFFIGFTFDKYKSIDNSNKTVYTDKTNLN